MKKISVRDLTRGTKETIKSVQKGETFVVTVRGEPVAVLTELPDEVALGVLPLGHPRVRAILKRASERRGGVPASKVLAEIKEILAAIGRGTATARSSRAT